MKHFAVLSVVAMFVLSGQVRKRKKKLSKAVYGTSHIVSVAEAKHIYKKGAERLIIGAGQDGMVKLSVKQLSTSSEGSARWMNATRRGWTVKGPSEEYDIEYRRLGKKRRYVLVSSDGTFVKEFSSHWEAKRFAKEHKISGWIARVLGHFEGKSKSPKSKR